MPGWQYSRPLGGARVPLGGNTHVRKDFAIFSGNANQDLARAMCQHLGQALGSAKVERFADGESYIEISQNVRQVVCFVVQPTSSPASLRATRPSASAPSWRPREGEATTEKERPRPRPRPRPRWEREKSVALGVIR